MVIRTQKYQKQNNKSVQKINKKWEYMYSLSYSTAEGAFSELINLFVEEAVKTSFGSDSSTKLKYPSVSSDSFLKVVCSTSESMITAARSVSWVACINLPVTVFSIFP